MLKLMTILEQGEVTSPYYDIGKDFNAFVQGEEAQTEQLRQRYSQAMDQKLKGKRIRARASIGFKQFVKDYEFDVHSVRVEDYYDEYVVIAHGFDGRRERDFFLIPKYKVQILGAAKSQEKAPEEEEPKVPEQPAPTPAPPQQPPAQAQAQPQTQPPQKPTVPVKEGSEGNLDKEEVAVELDRLLRHWLNPGVDVKKLAPNTFGKVTRGPKGSTVIRFNVKLPKAVFKQFDANKYTEFVKKLTKSLGELTVQYMVKVNDMGTDVDLIFTKVVVPTLTRPSLGSK